MCSAPRVKTPPPPPPAPTLQDPSVQAARADQRRRSAQMTGFRSTMLTGASGVASPATAMAKTLLGS